MKIKLSASVLCLSAMMLVVQPVSASVQTNNNVFDEKEHFKYSDLLEANDVMYLAERARTYAETHPQANLDELNRYFKQELRTNYKSKIDLIEQSIYPLPVSMPDLNPLEKALYDSNPYYGTLSLADGQTAMLETDKRYTDESETRGYGDAFQHAFWNAMMVNSTSVDWATKWATAYEDGAAYNPQLDKTMDLTNNSRGREIGINNGTLPRYYVSSLLPKVMAAVDAGKKVIIVYNQLVSSNSSGKL